MRALIPCLVTTICILFCQQTSARDCDTDTNAFIFPRVYYITYNGPASHAATPRALNEAVGNCARLGRLAESMFQHFEAQGFDMSGPRQNPYTPFNNEKYFFSPAATPENSEKRLVSETFFQYAKYRDSPVITGGWSLTALVDQIRPDGSVFPGGHFGMYGIARFNVHGRQFCHTYHERAPMGAFVDSDTSVFDIVTYNKDMGSGAGRGLAVLNGTQLDLRYMVTIPGDP